MPQQQAKAILVAGMHRCGTSAVAGTLRLLGVPMGERFVAPEASNVKGHWEHLDSTIWNNQTLALLGRHWNDSRPMPAQWPERSRQMGLGDELDRILAHDFAGQNLWAVKDPRISRLLPQWRDAVERMPCQPCLIICWRNPLDVAASLAKRDGLPQEHSLLLWLRYILEAEKASRDLPRRFIRFDDYLRDWQGCIKQAELAFGVTIHNGSPAAIDEFLDDELRHWSAPGGDLERVPGRLPALCARLTVALDHDAARDLPDLHAAFDAVGAELAELDTAVAQKKRPADAAMAKLARADQAAEDGRRDAIVKTILAQSQERLTQRDTLAGTLAHYTADLAQVKTMLAANETALAHWRQAAEELKAGNAEASLKTELKAALQAVEFHQGEARKSADEARKLTTEQSRVAKHYQAELKKLQKAHDVAAEAAKNWKQAAENTAKERQAALDALEFHRNEAAKTLAALEQLKAEQKKILEAAATERKSALDALEFHRNEAAKTLAALERLEAGHQAVLASSAKEHKAALDALEFYRGETAKAAASVKQLEAEKQKALDAIAFYQAEIGKLITERDAMTAGRDVAAKAAAHWQEATEAVIKERDAALALAEHYRKPHPDQRG